MRVFFFTIKGQITPNWMLQSVQNSNLSEILCPLQIIYNSHKDLTKTILRTRSNMVFFGTQGQVTPKWIVQSDSSDQHLNSSKILWLSWLSEIWRWFNWVKALFLHTTFSPFSTGFHRSRAKNSKVYSLIWAEIKLVWNFMDAVVTCQFYEGLIKNEVALLQTTFCPL